MKNLILLIAGIVFLATSVYAQNTTNQEIPITTSSEEARDLFLKGREQLENIDFVAAADFFDRAIMEDGDFALAYCYRALSRGGSEVQRASMEKAKSLADKVSEGERLFINYTQARLDVDRPKQKKYLDQLLAMFPGDKRVKVRAGRYHQSIRDYEKAAEYLTQATEIDPNFAPAYNYLGYAYMLGGNLEAAEKALKEYTRLVPDMPNPYDSYGELLMKMGRYDEAIIQYQKAYDTSNQFVSSLGRIGDNYVFKGDFAKARKYYQLYYDRAQQVEERLFALYYRMFSFVYENRLDAAVKAFGEIQSFAKNENLQEAFVNAHAHEGYVLTELGKPAEGLKKYEEAISLIDGVDLSDRQKENLRVTSNWWLAYAYVSNNMLAKAKSSAARYKQDIERRNNPVEETNLEGVLGMIDLKEGKYDAVIDRFSKLQPNPWSMYYQAQAYLRKGDTDAAGRLLNEIKNWNQNWLDLAVVWTRAQEESRI